MNPAQQAIDDAQRTFIGKDGKVDMAALLDAEAVLPAPAASGSGEIATLSATAQKPFIGKDGKVDMAALLEAEAGVIPLSASEPPEEVAAVEAVEAGYRHVKTLAAILNEEDAQQSFHVNVHEIISLNHPSTKE
jgi:hypothetical protein